MTYYFRDLLIVQHDGKNFRAKIYIESGDYLDSLGLNGTSWADEDFNGIFDSMEEVENTIRMFYDLKPSEQIEFMYTAKEVL